MVAQLKNLNIVKVLSSIPFMFIAVIYLVIADTRNWGVGDNYYGYFFVSMVIVFMFIEAFIPNNLDPIAFLADIVFAIASVVIITALIAYLYYTPEKAVTFYHWLAFAMVIADSIINQYKNYKRISTK